MPIQIEEVVQRSFTNWEELTNYVREQEETFIRIPFEEFYSQGAKFINGQLFGSNGLWITFNKEAMNTFCKLLHIPYHYLENLTEDRLVSNVLNSYLSNSVVKATLRNYQFVFDELSQTVSGLVSNTYMPYSNFTFLRNLTQLYPEILLKYSLKESYILNTNLYIRLLMSESICHTSEGNNDHNYKVGLQFSNGMTGKSSTKAKYYINQSTYDNSFVMPCSHVSGIVKHTGMPGTFLKRIRKNITPVIASISDVSNQIEILESIRFNLEKLIAFDGATYVYSILPLSNSDRLKRNNLNVEEKQEFDQKHIEEYIDTLLKNSKQLFSRDHASMLDFVNLFSEYAKNQTLSERIRTEEKSGELASWILQNQGEFEELHGSGFELVK